MVGAGLTGKIWTGDSRAAAVTWPAFDAGSGLLPLQIETRTLGRSSGLVRADYTVEPSPSDGLLLRVVEEYRLAEDGNSLVGEVTVTFLRDGQSRGSYVLHRRFERAP
jgi:hypothetical protein